MFNNLFFICALLLTGTVVFAQDSKPNNLELSSSVKWDGSFVFEYGSQLRKLIIEADSAYFEERSFTNELMSSGSIASNDVGFVLVPSQVQSSALVTEPVRVVFIEERDENILVEVRNLNSRNGQLITIERE